MQFLPKVRARTAAAVAEATPVQVAPETLAAEVTPVLLAEVILAAVAEATPVQVAPETLAAEVTPVLLAEVILAAVAEATPVQVVQETLAAEVTLALVAEVILAAVAEATLVQVVGVTPAAVAKAEEMVRTEAAEPHIPVTEIGCHQVQFRLCPRRSSLAFPAIGLHRSLVPIRVVNPVQAPHRLFAFVPPSTAVVQPPESMDLASPSVLKITLRTYDATPMASSGNNALGRTAQASAVAPSPGTLIPSTIANSTWVTIPINLPITATITTTGIGTGIEGMNGITTVTELDISSGITVGVWGVDTAIIMGAMVMDMVAIAIVRSAGDWAAGGSDQCTTTADIWATRTPTT